MRAARHIDEPSYEVMASSDELHLHVQEPPNAPPPTSSTKVMRAACRLEEGAHVLQVEHAARKSGNLSVLVGKPKLSDAN